MAELIDCVCCLCEVCCDRNSGHTCLALCACYMLYEDNVKQHHQRRHRCQQVTLVCLFSMVAIILSSICLGTFSKFMDPIENIYTNWQSSPIVDITLSQRCLDKQVVLAKYTMPETGTGCVCPETNLLVDKGVYSSSCGDGQNLGDCDTINGQDSIIMQTWSQLKNRKLDNTTPYEAFQICGTTGVTTQYDLLSQELYSQDVCLKMGHKVCETKDVKQYYCIYANDTCPITDFKLSITPLSDVQIETQDYILISTSPNYFAYISRTVPKPPIVSGIIVKGEGVCIYPSEISRNPQVKDDYILNDPQAVSCQIDQRYQSVAFTQENYLFEANQLTQEVISKRPMYNIMNIQYQLLIQGYYPFVESCRNGQFKEFVDLGDQFSLIQQNLIIELSFSCIFFFVLLILLSNELTLCFYQDCKCIPKVTYYIIRLSFQIVLTIFIILSYTSLHALVRTIDEFNANQCFDQITQGIILQVTSDINDIQVPLSVSLLICAIVVWIIDTFMSVFWGFGRYRKFKNKRQARTLELQQQQKGYVDPSQQQIQNNDYTGQPYQEPGYQYPVLDQPGQQQPGYNPYPQQYQPTAQVQNYQPSPFDGQNYGQPNIQYYAHQQPNMPQQQHIQPMQDHYPPPL